jgi:hypothetical protein
MPPFEAYEIDDGPVYGPGLERELEMAFFAGLVAEQSGADRFDLEGVSDPGAAGFLAETDFATQLLGVIQVAGVNSSMHFDVVDLALTPVNLTAVVALRDEPPHSDDRVITTFLIRVPKRGDRVPDQIWVELSIDGREETFSGKRPGSPD